MGKPGHNKKKRGSKESRPAKKQAPLLTEPTSFSSFAELTSHASNSVYAIARLRLDSNGQTILATLGTGFLAGPNRMMTCSHVIHDSNDSASQHKDDDLYLFVQRNHPHWHKTFINLTLNKTLFLEPDKDSAVIYLPDSFYFDANGNMLHDPNDHLHLSKSVPVLATEVGVLGYPLQQMQFTPDNSDVNINSVMVRADQGIVNVTYKTDENIAINEFTMNFNPGNSGGPIMDRKSGLVLALVHGFASIPIMAVKEVVAANQIEGGDKDAEGEVDVLSTIRALYSNGYSSVNYLDYESKHQISFK